MDEPRQKPRHELKNVSRRRAAMGNILTNYIMLIIVLINGVVLVRLYTQRIPDKLYGAWLAVGGLLGWLQLVDPGFSKALQQRVAITFGELDLDRLRRVIGTGLLIGGGLSLLALCGLPFAKWGVHSLGIVGADAVELERSLQIAIVGTAVALVSYQPLAVIAGLQKSYTMGTLHVASNLVCILVTVLMIVNDYGVQSIPVGMLCKNVFLLVCSLVVLLVWVWRYLPGRLTVERSELRAYGGLLSLSFLERVGDALIQQSDTIMVAWLVSPVSAVVYQLTGRAYEMVRIAVGRLAPAIAPSLSHLAGTKNSERLEEVIHRMSTYVGFLAAVGVASIICMNQAFVTLWVGPRFYGGMSLTYFLGVMMIVGILAGQLNEFLYATGGIRDAALAKFIEGVIRIPVQWFLAKQLGLVGIPLGACLAMIIVGTWMLPLALARRLHKESSYSWKLTALTYAKPIAITMFGFLLGLVVRQSNVASSWSRFVFASLGAGLSFSMLAVFFYSEIWSELAAVKQRIVGRTKSSPIARS